MSSTFGIGKRCSGVRSNPATLAASDIRAVKCSESPIAVPMYITRGRRPCTPDDGPTVLSPLLLPMFRPNMAAGRVSIEFRATGPSLHTATACASGATAIGTALGQLRSGACDVALAGGTDAMITPLCTAAFARMGALSTRSGDPATASRPFDAERDGFVLGEGAAVLVLERPGRAGPRPAHRLSRPADRQPHHPRPRPRRPRPGHGGRPPGRPDPRPQHLQRLRRLRRPERRPGLPHPPDRSGLSCPRPPRRRSTRWWTPPTATAARSTASGCPGSPAPARRSRPRPG